jgi:hypothetical protein
MIHNRKHPVCGGCYIEKVSAQLPRDAVTARPPVRCCSCSRPVSALIYWETPPSWLFVPYCPDVEAR